MTTGATVPGRFARRVSNKWRRFSIEHFGKRPFQLHPTRPYVSFTFDDYPRSALTEGGRILSKYGVRGTYFVSMNLLGKMSPSGPIVDTNELRATVSEGHELGCHTFDHLDGTRSTPEEFERSIARNRAELAKQDVDAELNVFAYPLDGPVLDIKRRVGTHFAACRGGGQTFNSGAIDLNLLKSYFLDQRSLQCVSRVARLIEQNAAQRGWLIFSTHDVTARPSTYGCESEYLEEVVSLSLRSGATVLPMARACKEIGIRGVLNRCQ